MKLLRLKMASALSQAWSTELRGFVTSDTRFISVRAVSSSDREHFLGLGFTERTYPEDYSIFLGPGLEHPSR